MKRLALAGTALAGALTLGTSADATVIVKAEDNGSSILLACTIGTGSANCTGGDASLNITSIAAQGNPALPAPDLSSLTIAATTRTGFSGTHVLTVEVFQDITPSVGPQNLTSSLTVNQLTGKFGPTTETTYYNGTDINNLGTTLDTFTFPFGTVSQTQVASKVVGVPITADAHSYSITFTKSGQSATDTIQLTGAPVPEPITLGMMGVGLVGLGLARRRR